MGEYGGWLRAGWYGEGETQTVINSETSMARKSAGVFDASPLGKIEVMGPDAEAFVNFIYYNTIKTLNPGFIRYGFMLTEGGAVYDDGVIARMDENCFVISCSSSHIDGVNALLEAYRSMLCPKALTLPVSTGLPSSRGTGSATRALRESLPLLGDRLSVDILTVEDHRTGEPLPGISVDIVLARHGIDANWTKIKRNWGPVTAQIRCCGVYYQCFYHPRHSAQPAVVRNTGPADL